MIEMKVLVVEDEESLHEILEAFLMLVFKTNGINGTVEIAANSDEAFGKLRDLSNKELAYDLLLTDKDCPRLDAGFDVMKYAKEHMPKIKIVLMSGNLSNDAVIMGERCGAVEFLAKPFSLEMFKRRMTTVIKN